MGANATAYDWSMNPSRMGSAYVNYTGSLTNDALTIKVQPNLVAGDNTNTTLASADYTNSSNSQFVTVSSETPVNASVANRYNVYANG